MTIAEIEDTPLYREAQEIMANGQTGTNFGWRVLIHYGDTQTLKPLKVVALNNNRNYTEAFSDITTLSVEVGLGVYAYDIYANRNNLQVSIFKLPQGELSEDDSGDNPIESERFSATLLDDGKAPLEGQGVEANGQFELDLTEIRRVNFQLFNKSIEQIRLMSVGNSFRNCTMESVLRAMLTKEAAKADVDEERAIVGVDIVPVSNEDKHPQVVITHGIKLTAVPDFLQKRYGIYNAGLGSYIQNKYWHIFPLFDTTQFNERQQTLTIIVLPQRKYMEVERTYRQVGDSLTVLMTGESAFKDDSGTQYLNQGNGARFSDARKQMEQVATVQGNKAVMSRKRNNNEFTTDKRDDGIQHVPMAADRITSNPFPIYSGLAGRNGGVFKGVWQNSDPKLILPGMMTRIIYSEQNETKEMYGVVHRAQHVSMGVGDIVSEKFTTQTVLEVFVNRSTDPA